MDKTLESIYEAEKKAEKTISNAKKKAEEVLLDSKKKAESLVMDAKLKLKEQHKLALEKVAKKLEEKKSKMFEEGIKESNILKKNAEKNIGSAVDYILDTFEKSL